MSALKYIIFWLASIWKAVQSIFYLKWVVRNYSHDKLDCFTYLKGRTAIVTGGNSGIGYATAVLLASRGCRVIIACRRDATKQKEEIIQLTGNSDITTKHLDLSKFKSIREFSKEIIEKEDKIEILVNNAGIGASSQCCTEDGLSTMMQVNFFGHVLLTYLLVDKLKASATPRVIFLSSMMANVHHLTSKTLNISKFKLTAENFACQYANSKLCAILAAQELNEELKEYGIKVTSVDPGVVRTSIFDTSYRVDMDRQWSTKFILEMLLFFFGTDKYVAAQGLFYLAAGDDIQAGSHYFRSKPFDKPEILKDKLFCKEIWDSTKKLIKIK